MENRFESWTPDGDAAAVQKARGLRNDANKQAKEAAELATLSSVRDSLQKLSRTLNTQDYYRYVRELDGKEAIHYVSPYSSRRDDLVETDGLELPRPVHIFLQKQFETLSRKDIQLEELESRNSLLLSFSRATSIALCSEYNVLRSRLIDAEDERDDLLKTEALYIEKTEEENRLSIEHLRSEMLEDLSYKLSSLSTFSQIAQKRSEIAWLEIQEEQTRQRLIEDSDIEISRIYASHMRHLFKASNRAAESVILSASGESRDSPSATPSSTVPPPAVNMNPIRTSSTVTSRHHRPTTTHQRGATPRNITPPAKMHPVEAYLKNRVPEHSKGAQDEEAWIDPTAAPDLLDRMRCSSPQTDAVLRAQARKRPNNRLKQILTDIEVESDGESDIGSYDDATTLQLRADSKYAEAAAITRSELAERRPFVPAWGWLLKSTGPLLSWQRRFVAFTRTGRLKYTAQDPMTASEIKWVHALNAEDIRRVEVDTYPNYATLPSVDQRQLFALYVDAESRYNSQRHQRFKFCCTGKSELNTWLRVLRAATDIVFALEEDKVIRPSPLRPDFRSLCETYSPLLLEVLGTKSALIDPDTHEFISLPTYRRRVQMEDDVATLLSQRKELEKQLHQREEDSLLHTTVYH